MAIVTGDRYLESLVKFVEKQVEPLLEGAWVLKLNPVGLQYVQTRLEQLQEVEGLLAGAPVDYLRAYVSDLGDYRALEQLRRILRLLTSLKVVSVLVPPTRDPTPLSLLPFDRLKFLELRGCDLSTSAARGLLELRHTLEKIICHNSTDALRHVFASRIVNIKASPMWNKLTFVSCACNGLVPMDESLQLLPAVEFLDLSRNRFAKVDNLRKCTKLRHLDLGFNHLRTIASLSEVSCPIVKLVLRNNALTTLRGIEHLKSVEGLDLSYNIISSFSELELLGNLSSLKSLWLEGNPICCARWYRAQVFSYFVHPDKLTLDEKGISKREFWKMHIVLASRMKKPAASGFYSPAKERCAIESTVNSKMKKFSRLASIEDDEPRSPFGSAAGDQEVGPLDGENLKGDEKDSKFGDDEEIISTPNRNEFMKKERAVSWLRDFAGYPDSKPDITMDNKKFVDPVFSNGRERGRRSKRMYSHLGESSTCVLKFQSLEDVASKIRTESELSCSDAFTDLHACDTPTYKKDNGVDFGRVEGSFEAKPLKHKVPTSSHDACLSCDRLKLEGRGFQRDNKSSFAAIDEILGSRATSMNSASPPHYEKGILHRRHNLEEEVIQISAESYSVESSDSDTSFCPDDDSCTYDASYHVDFNLSDEGSTHSSLVNYREEDFGESYNGSLEEELQRRQITEFLQDSAFEPEAEAIKEISDHSGDSDISTTGLHLAFLDKRKNKRRPKRRLVSLLEENSTADNGKILPKSNGILEASKHTLQQSEIIVNENVGMVKDVWIESISKDGNAAVETDDFVKKYVDAKITNHGVTETCTESVRCSCMIQGSDCMEVDVVVLLSSESSIYVIVIDSAESCTGKPPSVLGCHKREDIKGILVGLGLQVVRVDIEGHAPYLFIMRSMENVRDFFYLLQVHDSAETNSVYSFRSWDQVQARKFEKDICKGSMMSIYLFSMLLVWQKSTEGWSWHSRSLFFVDGYLLVCTEDLEQFGYSVENDEEASPYFSLDVCFSIDCINEMVIETDESRCVTLIIGNVGSTGTHFLAKLEKEKQPEQKSVDQVTWRFKWFSQDTLYKFVGLLKAMHAGVATFPLSLRSTT